MRERSACWKVFITLAVLLWFAPRASAQIPGARAVGVDRPNPHIVKEMTPERIAEAIAAGEQGKYDVNRLYVRKSTETIGAIATPFMRVATVAMRARVAYKRLKPEDVPPELIKPELHVYVWDRGPVWDPDNKIQAVVITNSFGKYAEKQASAIQPTSYEIVPASIRDALGLEPSLPWKLAVFPLELLNESREIHVVYRESISISDSQNVVRDWCLDCASDPLKFRDAR